MKIYTKTGDKGETSLFNGKRVTKDNLRVNCYGTVDELNSVIGISLSFDLPDNIRQKLLHISNLLFNLGSDLATPLKSKNENKITRIHKKDIEFLEKSIDELSLELPALKGFILPIGNQPATFLHLARTICRRAERLVVSLQNIQPIGKNPLIFLNRLSDFLFTASRYVNSKSGINDTYWKK